MDVFENCRICLREINHEPIKMTRLISRFLENSLLLKNVAKPSPQDNAKQNLCAPCFNRISEFQDFLEQCKDSEEFWREQFEDIKPTLGNQVTSEESELIPYQEDNIYLEADTTVSTTEIKLLKQTQLKETYEENTFHLQEIECDQNLRLEEKVRDCEDDATGIEGFVSINLTNWEDEANDNCETQINLNDCNNSSRNADEQLIEYEFDENEEVEIEEVTNFDELESPSTCGVDYRSFAYEKIETRKSSESSNFRETIDEIFEESSAASESSFFPTTSVDDNGKPKTSYKCPKCGSDNGGPKSDQLIPKYQKISDKSFSRIYDIESHYNIHSGIKPFTCDVCGKSFRQKNILTTHQALHFGKKVECDECGKKFARRSQLILHYRMHRDEKPFVCRVDGCQGAFRQRKQLVDHSFIHTGEKNFQCATCTKLFHTRKRLQDHIYKVHSQHRYRCELCEKAFLKPHMLKHHMITVHNVEIVDVSHLKTLVGVIKPTKTVHK